MLTGQLCRGRLQHHLRHSMPSTRPEGPGVSYVAKFDSEMLQHMTPFVKKLSDTRHLDMYHELSFSRLLQEMLF
jgi:hypothetical protein